MNFSSDLTRVFPTDLAFNEANNLSHVKKEAYLLENNGLSPADGWNAALSHVEQN